MAPSTPLGRDNNRAELTDSDGTRFDPFSLPTLADAVRQGSAQTETEKLARDRQWFAEEKLRGSHALTKTHKLNPEDLLDWSGYGSDALDSDALVLADSVDRCGPTVVPSDAPPKRVLDVGCGIYGSWILTAAKWPGWHETRFVGLDVAPVLVPPSSVMSNSARRISFIQHNLLQPLPFLDECFDYIRCGQLAAGIPEPAWDPFIEELRRCLGSDGTLEIVETSSRPVPPPRLQPALELVLSHRLLNLDLRSLIPAAFAMNNMRNITALRSNPPSPTAARPPPNPTPCELAAPMLTTDRDRVLTAAWARSTGAHGRYLAEAVARAGSLVKERDTQQAGGPDERASARSTASQLNPVIPTDTQHEIETWTAELLDGASIASLMRQRWGWTCKVEEDSRSILTDQLRDIDTLMRKIESAILAYEERAGPNAREERAEVARVRKDRLELQQAKTYRRQLSVLLEAVERRLSSCTPHAAVARGEPFALEVWAGRK